MLSILQSTCIEHGHLKTDVDILQPVNWPVTSSREILHNLLSLAWYIAGNRFTSQRYFTTTIYYKVIIIIIFGHDAWHILFSIVNHIYSLSNLLIQFKHGELFDLRYLNCFSSTIKTSHKKDPKKTNKQKAAIKMKTRRAYKIIFGQIQKNRFNIMTF